MPTPALTLDGATVPLLSVGPAEIVDLYMTGLGPVIPPVGTGDPAPLDRLTSLREPLACRWWQEGLAAPLDVLFAGLAPGMIGIHQVSVRLPANPRTLDTDASRTTIALQCGDPDPNEYGDSALVHVQLTRP
jgi:uncharacterized protein (TIGR03437 family)